MANILNNPSHRAQIGYNGFDMSSRLLFSSTVGELLPVYFDFLKPGDKVTARTELKTRTMPLSTAAMAVVNEYVDWFFVPMEHLYSLFGSFVYGIQDFKSSLFKASDVKNHIPYLKPATLLSVIQAMSNADSVFGSTYLPTTISGDHMRLFELLGVPVERILKGSSQPVNVLSLSPLLFCAYQKIYYDYFRLSDREDNVQKAYNLDFWYDDGEILPNTYSDDMFKLRYCPWPRDFFTNLFTSPLMNLTGVGSFPNQTVGLDSLSESFHQWLTSDIAVGTVDTTGSSSASGSDVVSTSPGHTGAISVSGIRTAFAVQKLLEITRRSGKHYDAQTLAHFGISVPTGISGEVYHFGNDSSVLKIGDVIATSSSSNGSDSSVLGEVAGKGYNYSNSSSSRFEAPCHGIMMGIYHAVPDINYSSVFFDKLNGLIERSDFYLPEFDNLGMQPLFKFQAVYQPWNTGYATRLGWQYRYSEIKSKFNRAALGLSRLRSLSDWTVQRYVDSTNLNNFLVTPTALNSILLSPYSFAFSGNNATDYATDPLLHELYMDVKKSSKMSTYGLESL